MTIPCYVIFKVNTQNSRNIALLVEDYLTNNDINQWKIKTEYDLLKNNFRKTI